MQRDDYQIAMGLFEEVSALPPEARDARLSEASVSESVMRRVRAMLAADESGSEIGAGGGGQGLVSRLVTRETDEDRIAGLFPQLRGHYRILRLIGEGGSGAVYEAEQLSPRRMVALKALRPGRTSRRALRRLEVEAHVQGRLQHPTIAQVYEAGVADADHPDQAFIAMELVRGVPITAHARLRRLSTHERLDLFLAVCAGVSHAHQRGVIHRDLKPANILVDESGRPRILDFGVARVTGSSMDVDATATQHGQIVGTLQYMSPEQASGDPSAVDVRSDVFALGALLYELLTGRTPLDLDDLSLPAALERVRTERPTPAGSVVSELRGDLETIIARAMDPEKERRYASVQALTDDIHNHLEGRPIEARRDSLTYVMSRVAHRHRKSLAAAAVVLVGLIAFGVHSSVQARRNAELASSEAVARNRAELALESRTREKERADATAESLRRSLYFSHIAVAHAAVFAGDRRGVRRALDACPEDLRGWEWSYLRRYIERSVSEVTAFSSGPMYMDAVGNGSLVVVSSGAAGLAVVDSEQGTVVERAAHDAMIVIVAGSDDGTVAIGDNEGRIIVKRSITAEPIATIDTGLGVARGLFLVDDARRVFVIGQSGVIQEWSIAEGRKLGEWKVPNAGATTAAARAPMSDRLYLAGEYGVARFDHSTGSFDHLLSSDATILSLDVDRDERYLAIGDDMRTVCVYELQDLRIAFLYRGHGSRVIAVRMSPDGTHLATGSGDSTVRYFNIATGDEVERLLAHEATVTGLAFAGPDRLVSAGRDGFVRTWTVSTNARAIAARWKRDDVSALLPTPAGLSIAGAAPAFARIDPESGLALWTDNSTSHGVRVFEVDGVVITLATDGQVIARTSDRLVWSLDAGEEIRGGAIREHLLSIGVDHKLVSVDARTGDIVESIDFGEEMPIGIATGDTWRLVTCVSGRLCVVRDGKIVHAFDGHAGGAWCAALNPQETLVATSGEDGVIRLWDPRDWRSMGTLGGDQLAIISLDFAPDGSRLATAGFDTTVRIWSMEERAEVLRLSGHVWAVQAVAFDPGSGSLYSGASDGVIRRWRVSDGWTWQESSDSAAGDTP